MGAEHSIHDLEKVSETPTGVVSAYLELLDRGLFRSAHHLLSQTDKDAVPHGIFIKDWLDEENPSRVIVERTIYPPTFTKKGVADIPVATLYNDGVIMNDNITVVLELRSWRIRLGFDEAL